MRLGPAVDSHVFKGAMSAPSPRETTGTSDVHPVHQIPGPLPGAVPAGSRSVKVQSIVHQIRSSPEAGLKTSSILLADHDPIRVPPMILVLPKISPALAEPWM